MFVRAGEVGDRRFTPARLAGLYANADLRPAPGDATTTHKFAFRTAKDEEVETDNPELAALLREMGAHYPRCVSLAPYAGGQAIVEPLLRAVFGGAVNLRLKPHVFTFELGEKPLASRLARAQAGLGEQYVASLRGGAAGLGDAAVRALLLLLDGTRTQDDVAAAMAERMNVSLADARARLPGVLAHLARLGLIMAGPAGA